MIIPEEVFLEFLKAKSLNRQIVLTGFTRMNILLESILEEVK